jgi:Alpha/beta hydrolase domain/FG-GAP-like repeat
MTDTARGAASKCAFDSIKHKLLGLGIAGLLGIGAVASPAQAATGVTSVTVTGSGPAFGGCTVGSVGTFSYARGWAIDVIDPTNPLNTPIIDIANAQKDSNGMVEVMFNFDIVYPTNLANGNGKVIADIPNRSGSTLNQPGRQAGTNTPETSTVNCGNTFFYSQGYTTTDVGWEADPGVNPQTSTSYSAVGTVNGAGTTPLTMMPIAVGPSNATLTGPSYEYIVVGANTGSFNVGGGLTTPNYPAAPLGASCTTNAVATLTHRQHLDDTPTVLPAANWQWNIGTDGNCDSISLTTAGDNNTPYYTACAQPTGACFISQDIYELSYTAANPTVNGAGMAVIRDFHSWLKGNSGVQTNNPLTGGYVKQIYSWTSSQPARTINDYIHFGFNGDLGGKRVIDGMVNWIGAGSGLSFNYRWSHTTGTERNRQQHLWVESFFPFADVTTTDPISGTTDGRYLKCSQNNTCPVMNLEQYSANEYWVKTASLFHTDPTGTTDLPDHPLTRKYYMSGMQHGGGNQTSKASVGVCQNWNNPTDPTYTMHALYTALDQAVTGNIPPPPSQIPTLAGKTLVLPENLPFPSGWTQTTSAGTIPVLYTALETTRYRFNMGPTFYQTGIPTINPPVITGVFENNRANGPIYPSYVPAVNADGNDVTGILLPEHLAPLATYAGWNYRSTANDGPDGCESTGSYIPFAATTPASGDPRPSVAQRFPTYGAYVNAVVAAVDKLVWNRFALCGVDAQTMLANKLSTAYATSVAATAPSNQQPSIVPANADWTYVTGANPSTPVPPAIIPACNAALTHNFNGATGQLQTGAAIQVPLVAGFDGNSDILWRDTSGNVGLWLMNGTSIQQTAVVANVPTSWSIVGQRDFNADGNTDLLWRDTSGNVGIWLMNGTGIQSTSVLGNVPTSWSVVGIIGFNTGGYNNILWRNSNGDVGIWFMNGTTVVNTTTIGNMPTNWVIAGSDTRGNIFWRNSTTGDVQMWVLNGTQAVKTADLGVVPLTWNIAGIGDFDGNGSTDLVWQDNAGNVGIWLMSGTTVLSTAIVGNAPSIWSIAATGDYNGDGKSDLLWKDSSGNVGAWFMNGATISSSVIYGNVGTTWNVQAMNSE